MNKSKYTADLKIPTWVFQKLEEEATNLNSNVYIMINDILIDHLNDFEMEKDGKYEKVWIENK